MIKHGLALLGFALLANPAHATFQPVVPTDRCPMRAEDVSANGRPLTYETARQLGSATMIASSGAVRLSPVTLPSGREATVAIDRDGCARLVSVHGLR